MRSFLAMAALGAAVVFTTAVAAQTTNGAPQSAPAAGAMDGYPLSWRRNFVQGCLAGPSQTPKAVCECGIRNIELEVPFAESQALDAAALAGREPDPRTLEQYRSVMQRCIANPDL